MCHDKYSVQKCEADVGSGWYTRKRGLCVILIPLNWDALKWLHRLLAEKTAGVSVDSIFAMDAVGSCSGICWALCCRDWPSTEGALAVPARLPAAQESWCSSSSFMLQLLPAASLSWTVAQEPFRCSQL